MSQDTVMLIDGVTQSRGFYTLALQSQGYAVLASSTADQVEGVIARHNPGLLMLDMTLPGTNPYDLCGQIRAHFINLPILLLTDRQVAIAPVEQRWAISRGATDIMLKSTYQVDTLLLRVNQLTRSLSFINRQALQQALLALQVEAAPDGPSSAVRYRGSVVEPAPTELSQRPQGKGFLGGLQSAWSALQSKAPTPSEEDNSSVVRYRGTLIKP